MDYFTLCKFKIICFLDSMRWMPLKLFATENIVTDERGNDDGDEAFCMDIDGSNCKLC